MRAQFLVVIDVLVKHMQWISLVQHDDVLETFPPERSDDALRDSIRVRCVHRSRDRRDPDVCRVLDEVLPYRRSWSRMR